MISSRVEPVTKVAPQVEQVTVAMWKAGWMFFFIFLSPFAVRLINRTESGNIIEERVMPSKEIFRQFSRYYLGDFARKTGLF